ncbi:SDR family oxidoreductase [Polynucleobacter paneuropaeus]|nr:SDR family oxidoreductase [Polynucleobacter paneuropaeus]
MKKNILLVGGCGYIGSFLFTKLKDAGCSVVVCDILKRGNPLKLDLINKDYSELDDIELINYDAVLWFAGHSSVSLSISDPEGALKNNCLNLYTFAQRLPATTKFIYASSASLYSKQGTDIRASSEESLVTIPAQNPYDISKFAFDYIAKGFLKNFYGLRMGTLCGYSPNLRPELVFNAMNISANQSGIVLLKNASSNRTILFLDDLWILIRQLIFFDYPSGFINVGSVSNNLDSIAHKIAEVWRAKVVNEGNSESYSFLLDTTLMRNICGKDLKPRDFSTECRDLVEQIEASRGRL